MNASTKAITTAMGLVLLGLGGGQARGGPSLDLSVVVDGHSQPEYAARGTVYVEAVRDREYRIRLVNPLPVRVAVALAVDGLNTIDARRTTALEASKWVLDPYETVEIPGWQVSGAEARRFVFTGERSSYGAWLGKTEDLGVIEAVFFREKTRAQDVALQRGNPGGPPGAAAAEAKKAARAEQSPSLSDEYAATGFGARTGHRVTRVRMALEPSPAKVIRLRYEFHDQLVALGVLSPHVSPLARREGASGFAGRYCPDPR